jgi:hypothetical protein
MMNMNGPSFNVTAQEALLISKIARRAVRLAKKYEVDYDFMTANMDITACHANGCPLRLGELLNADDGNFGHDVFGIRRHIDRETGKMTSCFLPRFYNSKRTRKVPAHA